MSSEITPNDIRYVESTVHKTITLSNESDGISTVTFISASSPTNATSSEFHYYNAINHLHYRPIAHTQWGNSWIPEMYGIYDHDHYRQSGSSDSSWTRTEFDNFRPQYKNKFHDKGLLLNLSSSRYGNQIKPGTFRLTDTSNGTGDLTFDLIDDGFGNLYNPNPQVSQSNNTSISSSENYVGNIFYEQGLIVLTETGSYFNTYWDLDSATYETQSPSMASENGIPQGIWFKPDGTRYYMIGSSGGKEGVYEYSMTTAWDVSTATYTGNSLDLSHYTLDAWRSVSFNPAGTKIFVTNKESDTMKAFDLDIAWDLTSFDTGDFGSIETFTIDDDSYGEANVQAHYFREDGLKFYLIGATNHAVQEHNLSSAFDLTSVTSVSQSFNVSESMAEIENEFFGLHFKPDGTRMYTVGNTRNMAYEHRLSTAWDVSTATFYTSKSVDDQVNEPTDITWKPDGSKMYVLDYRHATTNDILYQYQTSASFYTDGGTNYSMSYDSDVSIKTMEFTCKIPADQYNITSNPTILSSSLGYPSVEQTKWFDYNVQATRSFWNIVDGEIAIPYRDRNFQPYITHIALFNEDDEPLIKTSFPHPIRKPDDQDLVIKVQMDY